MNLFETYFCSGLPIGMQVYIHIVDKNKQNSCIVKVMRLQLCYNVFKIVLYRIDSFSHYCPLLVCSCHLPWRKGTPTLWFPQTAPRVQLKQTNVLLIARDIFVLSTKTSFFQPSVLSSPSMRHFLRGVDFAVMGWVSLTGLAIAFYLKERAARIQWIIY